MSRALLLGVSRLLSFRACSSLQKLQQSPLPSAKKAVTFRNLTCSSYLSSMSVAEKFAKGGVVPDVLNTAPTIAAKVKGCEIVGGFSEC